MREVIGDILRLIALPFIIYYGSKLLDAITTIEVKDE